MKRPAREKEEEPILAEERAYKVNKLERGTVIDHLRRGSGLKVLHVLGLEEAGTVTLGLNLESKRLGRKDLIKIEGRELTRQEVNKIAILSPEATLSIIRNYRVVKKMTPQLEDVLEGIVRCRNPACVSNHERIQTRFLVERRQPLRVRCGYCERAVSQEEVELL